MTIKEFFSFKKNFFFWGNLWAMALVSVALVWGVFKWLDIYTRHDVSVTVPEVKGMLLPEAQQLLEKHSLKPIISDSTYSPSQPGGMVLDMNPTQGAVVKEGRAVYLTVNTNRPPMRIIPNLIDNSSLRQAEAKLLAMGFKLGENDSIEGEKDWIYGIKYKGAHLQNGDEVPIGATLVLEVGSGEYAMGFGEDSLQTRDISVDEATLVDDSWFE